MPRRIPAALLAFASAIIVPLAATAGDRPAPDSAQHVIPADAEGVFRAIATSGAPLPAGWEIDAVSIRVVAATIRFAGPGGRQVEIELVHPDVGARPVARTTKFAIVAASPDAVPAELLDALTSRVAAAEPAFAWQRRVAVTAVPIHRLNRPTVALPDERAREAWDAARRLLDEGRVKDAVAAAEDLVRSNPGSWEVRRAAASLARSAGDGAVAARLLNPDRPPPRPEGDDRRLRLEVAASVELAVANGAAGMDVLAARAIESMVAADYPRVYGESACARADALTILVQEGRAADVARILPPPARRTAHCTHLLAVKVADALGPDDGIDAAAADALKAFPEDPDVLFLWGTHYYNRLDLDRSIEIWDRLAAIQPDYPTLLGQYGTAYLVGLRLDWRAVGDLMARADSNPDDLVANYLAAIGLYYLKGYADVIPLLTRVVDVTPDEPRARMYLAMAHFFAGDPMRGLLMIEALTDWAYQEPDIYYCRSLIYRSFDLPRATAEMAKFLDVFEGGHRLRFGEQKVRKAKSDLELMRKGIVPEVALPEAPYVPVTAWPDR